MARSEAAAYVDQLDWNALRKQCKERGLGAGGTAKELKERLLEDLENTYNTVVNGGEVPPVAQTSDSKSVMAAESSGSAMPHKRSRKSTVPKQAMPDGTPVLATTGRSSPRRPPRAAGPRPSMLAAASDVALPPDDVAVLPTPKPAASSEPAAAPAAEPTNTPRGPPSDWRVPLAATAMILLVALVIAAALPAPREAGLAHAKAFAGNAHQLVLRGVGHAKALRETAAQRGLRGLEGGRAALGNACRDLRHLLGTAVANLRHHLEDAYAAVEPILQAVYNSFKLRLGSRSPKVSHPACATAIDPAVLDKIVAPGAMWDGVRATLADVLSGHKDNPSKATGVLLATPSPEAGARALKALAAHVPQLCKSSCLLRLQAAEWKGEEPDLRGKLQSQLAETLKRCPSPVVLVEGLGQAPPAVLPVLINALSEGGSFLDNGSTVPSHGALFFATLESPHALEQAEEHLLKAAAKLHLVSTFQNADSAGPETHGHALALRRRFEHVIPVSA